MHPALASVLTAGRHKYKCAFGLWLYPASRQQAVFLLPQPFVEFLIQSLAKMKLIAAFATLALPLMSEAACLTARQIANWNEGNWRARIEVVFNAEAGYSNTWKMAEDYCASYMSKLHVPLSDTLIMT